MIESHVQFCSCEPCSNFSSIFPRGLLAFEILCHMRSNVFHNWSFVFVIESVPCERIMVVVFHTSTFTNPFLLLVLRHGELSLFLAYGFEQSPLQ